MIVTSNLGTTALLLPIRPCPACDRDQPHYQCTGHRICRHCGLVTIEPQETP